MNRKQKNIEKGIGDDKEITVGYIDLYKDRFDSIAVLDTPLEIDGETIYGVMYNKEQEKLLKANTPNNIDRYIAYHRGIELWLKAGCDVIPDGKFWYYPEDQSLIKCTPSVLKIIYTLMKNQSGNTKYEFDEYIVWNDDEVDDRENRMILNESLIRRYVEKGKPMVTDGTDVESETPIQINCECDG